MEKNKRITAIRYHKDGTRTFRRIDIADVYDFICRERFKDPINIYRYNFPLLQREMPEMRKNRTFQLLENVPMLCFHTEMSRQNNEENIASFTYLLLLTISNLRNNDMAERLRTQASALPYTRMAFVGADGMSVNIVVELSPLGKDIADEADYNQLLHRGFAALRKIYSDHLHCTIDNTEPSLTSECRISIDKDAYYSSISTPFHVDMLSKTPNILDAKESPMPPQVEDREEMHEWRRIYIDNLRKAQEATFCSNDIPFETLLLLARYCHETGMPQALAERYASLNKELSDDITLIRDTFATEYEKEFRNANPHRHINPTSQMILRTNNFLNVHFRFRRNVLNGIVEYRVNDGTDFTYHLLTDEAQNTMTLMALEHGLNSWDKDLKRYIHSLRIPEYNPINSFLDALPKWDGKDHVSKMAQRVPTDTPNWERNFHIWMRSMVAQWMGRDEQHGNAIAPILIGAQATGKSSFCRIILPESLLSYYNDNIDFKDDKSVFLALSSFALINIDEFDSLSKSQQPLLKYLISKTDVKYRAAYRSFIEQHKRYASFIGTTNKPRPLSDPTGSRRFICVHVKDAIDFSTPVDYQQLYAQLKEEVIRGERYWFTLEETDAITRQNATFQCAEDLRKVIPSLFRIPEQGEESKLLTTEEIAQHIRNSYPEAAFPHDMNMKIGRIMKQSGFERVRHSDARKYRVISK